MLRLPALLFLISCGDKEEAEPDAASRAAAPTDCPVEFSEDEELEGLRFTLRLVTPPSESTEGARVATGTALSDGEIH